MSTPKSKKAENSNYHDYVIKNGKFIGDFETMYQNVNDPWMQSIQPNRYSRNAGIIHIKNFGITSILEVGCGLGYYAEWIYQETNIVPKSIDISATAVSKAKEKFPHLDFELADITKNIDSFKTREAIILSEVVWYILPNLKALFKALSESSKGKYLIVNQVFYKGSQKYGNEYFTDLQEFIDFVPFELLAYSESSAVKDTTIETSVIFKIT
ncbi:MAG: class I SAM-dependent methyltransferase [Salibacteraceae bacterium]|nr:class I SAM-dependent methyltransferase [Salibacteraceae bacterium]|tara:strand:+ start:1339 stop:1974 length:636 start_codon:yes stop_codon:yes gene_type:complete